MHVFQIFFLNFWVWWYLVKGKEMLQNAWGFWLYTFDMLRIGAMLGNLFQPFFQDKSWTGRIVAFPIRFIWGTIGLIIQIIFSIMLVFGLALYFILPVSLVILFFKSTLSLIV